MTKRKLDSEKNMDLFIQPSILCRKVILSDDIVRRCAPTDRFTIPITHLDYNIIKLTETSLNLTTTYKDFDKNMCDFITKYTVEFDPSHYENNTLIIVLNACWQDTESHSSLPCCCMEYYYNCNECVPGHWIEYLAYSLRRNYPQHAFVSTCPSCELGPQCFKKDGQSYDDKLVEPQKHKDRRLVLNGV